MNHTQRLIKRVSLASVSLAVSLAILKIWAWWLTDSVSLLASLMDSATDILASGINLFAVRYAMIDADDNHHYGHGKAESLSALAQGMFIAGSSIFLIVNAFPRLFTPQVLHHDFAGIVVMIISILGTLALVCYQRHILKFIDSQSVRADSLNYLNDLLTNCGVLFALIFSSLLGWTIADPVFAIIVAFWMLRGVWIILKEAIATLMDVALPVEEMQQIERAIDSVSGHLGAHLLRARRSGQWRIIDMHLEFDDHISLTEAHEINDHVEEAISKCFAGPCEIMIHLEPVSVAYVDRFKIGVGTQ
ncbi:cation diffusion facilitator family transporter [Suttonella ornithocola]|uniref:Ferrous-iron efflux pump FieF n=1 Tax=Suttonella ornithocola TaxID=279832 RepID=A0A380MNU0_9GAMM|nr:cation diffusion facilitator family transporter [Suttonella ornithocola]SUO93563.1 Ferrous-iron efflux pump FieF [Suttonella ornithocola]